MPMEIWTHSVASRNLAVRKEPGVNSEVVRWLQQGSHLRMLDYAPEFANGCEYVAIETVFQCRGWINAEYISAGKSYG
jgi:hypothetical protein